jgi:hypothetical protein
MLLSDISYVMKRLYAQNMQHQFLQIIYCSNWPQEVVTFLKMAIIQTVKKDKL